MPRGNDLQGSYNLSISKDSSNFSGYPHFWAPEVISVGDVSTAVILQLNPAAYSGFFLDYVIQEDSANNIMQSGTIRAIFNGDGSIITWSNNNILSMGNTSGIAFMLGMNGSELELTVDNSLGNTYPININTTSRLILRKTLT